MGGGPSGLFMFKRLVDWGKTDIEIHVFEKNKELGSGMPYSADGANDEHVTNVSGNEIPELVTPLDAWIRTVSRDTLNKFHINPENFNEYKVLPRLLFGQYLSAEFGMLQQLAKEAGIDFTIHYGFEIKDIKDYPKQEVIEVIAADKQTFEVDVAVLCTGHRWPKRREGKVTGYFDSPYPPLKIALQLNHPVAIRGSSLTAVDAIRTLSRYNGIYEKDEEGKLHYKLYKESKGFSIMMHSRNGMLPAVRFHLEDSHLSNSSLLSTDEIAEHIKANDGYLSLDYIFEKDFKEIFKEKDPGFYEKIKDKSIEQFVEMMMAEREAADAFELMKAEYAEAEQSIKQRKSIFWKEMLGVLSFAMNYPAKHLSAEDMLRLQKTLIPLISIVIAYIPQSSCDEMLALHEAGLLDIVEVGDDGRVEPGDEGGATYHYYGKDGKSRSVFYKTYVDCIGQPHLNFEDFPFESLVNKKTISPASLKFRSTDEGKHMMEAGNKLIKQDNSGNYYLQVPGIAINDNFQVVDEYGALNERIYIMAVPYIGGYNPDYSGLDFCEEASEKIIKSMFEN